MKKLFYFLTAMFLILGAIAQNPGDTIVVQTFIHDAWTDGIGNSTGGGARDTIGYFPNDPNLSFEKIIMCYNMRCKDNNNNNPGGTSRIGCGAYDYSCQTYVHDSTRVDSILNFTPDHIISGFNGSTYHYSTNPIYNYFYAINPSGLLVLDSIIAAADTIIEIGISTSPGTLNHDIFDTISTNIYWEAYSYTYDTSGNVINIDTIGSNGIININQLTYYKRYPMAFQIMSFVTPYGMGLDFGSTGETWYFDVTDYSPILKGNKQITISGGGQWQEDMDIKFLFIVGTPPRDVLEMQQIWRPQSKGYGTIMADDAFEPRDVLMHPNATDYKLRTTITGHGQEGEFISQNHYLNIDGGGQEYIWPVWTECAENPVYPQGGTWIYDRAGWCPGQASDLREDDITQLVNPGQIHNIDYGVSSATGTSNYWVSSQLVSYGAPNHSLDAAIIDILSPTNQILHLRTNPLCSKPKITIQNTGNTTLTSLQIEYWVNGATSHEMYQWNGNLNFLEKEEVELPDPASLWGNIAANNNIFHVIISLPNNATDQYYFNNIMNSSFESAPTYPNTFALWFQTNSGVVNSSTQISESSWEFFDNNENSIYASGDLISNTLFQDTLTFDDGCYVFKVTDTDDDGFDFWANNDGGGMARFREIGASWLKSFDGDFGRFIHHEFRIEDALSTSEIDDINISIFPNPANDKILVSGDLGNSSEITLTDNIGRIVSITKIDKNNTSHKIDISRLSKGIYFISIDDNKTIKKIVKQ
jgi:hypothetical protein